MKQGGGEWVGDLEKNSLRKCMMLVGEGDFTLRDERVEFAGS
jgi:hypothetical protein